PTVKTSSRGCRRKTVEPRDRILRQRRRCNGSLLHQGLGTRNRITSDSRETAVRRVQRRLRQCHSKSRAGRRDQESCSSFQSGASTWTLSISTTSYHGDKAVTRRRWLLTEVRHPV